MRAIKVVTMSAGIALSQLLGGEILQPEPVEENETSYSISIATYLSQHGRDYANPTFTLDRGVFHFETRYNYEAIKTGSVWVGYNFAFGNKLAIEAAPMLGGVFGDITGVAPGYTISASWKSIEFYTQGEYFVDAGSSAGNFFYTWTELSYTMLDHFRVGLVLDRTKALGENFEVRRGPLIGFNYNKFDLSTYWLSPGTRDATFIFVVTMEF